MLKTLSTSRVRAVLFVFGISVDSSDSNCLNIVVATHLKLNNRTVIDRFDEYKTGTAIKTVIIVQHSSVDGDFEGKVPLDARFGSVCCG